MDFVSLVLFLITYYIRPYEWPAMRWMQSFRPVTVVMIIALIAMLTRHRGFTFRDFFKTPHDWMMSVYCLWIVFASPTPWATFNTTYALYLFYAVTVQALSSIERIRLFLKWWALLIFVLAGLAVLSEYGFDPTESHDKTQYIMKGRLAFGSSLFNNPNALGHSVVPIILMLYFLFVWQRPIFIRVGSIPLFAVPIFCIYLTVSKGAFLSGFASAAASLSFGRPKGVQVLIVVFCATVGITTIKMLPRMQEIQSSKTDEAIQGRVRAFQFGYMKLTHTFCGIGKDNFVGTILREQQLWKASHSSYVCVGSELGFCGLAFFLGCLYCGLRTLMTAQTRDTEEERVRRLLFSMVTSFMVSSWMVDFAYRATYFMFLGAIAAFHRLLLEKPQETGEETVEQAIQQTAAPHGHELQPLRSGTPALVNQTTVAATTITIPHRLVLHEEDEPHQQLVPGMTWNRIQFMDIVLIVCLTVTVVYVWRYAMETM